VLKQVYGNGDGVAQLFYYHSFYYFEPDLNIKNKEVQKEILNIMDFWLQHGIDGFRIDAATLLFAQKGIEGSEVEDSAAILGEWYSFIKNKNPHAIMLGEADVEADQIPLYFGTGDRMELLYSFLLNRYIFLSFAQSNAKPMKDYIQKLPFPPEKAQWVHFIRNHMMS